MTAHEWHGVWLSDTPLEANDGPSGDALLAVDLRLPEAAIADYEWQEQGKGYREWLVPAALINANATVVIQATD